jgi:hypothetical protein
MVILDADGPQRLYQARIAPAPARLLVPVSQVVEELAQFFRAAFVKAPVLQEPEQVLQEDAAALGRGGRPLLVFAVKQPLFDVAFQFLTADRQCRISGIGEKRIRVQRFLPSSGSFWVFWATTVVFASAES